MIDDFIALPKNSEPFQLPVALLRGSSFLGHRHDEDVMFAALEAEQKRNRVFMRAMSIVFGAIMAVLIVITAVALLDILNPVGEPAANGFETAVRSGLSPAGVGAECRPFRKCQSFRRDGVDG